jgi:hypothetical protein
MLWKDLNKPKIVEQRRDDDHELQDLEGQNCIQFAVECLAGYVFAFIKICHDVRLFGIIIPLITRLGT